jgi:hypothetical protein
VNVGWDSLSNELKWSETPPWLNENVCQLSQCEVSIKFKMLVNTKIYRKFPSFQVGPVDMQSHSVLTQSSWSLTLLTEYYSLSTKSVRGGWDLTSSESGNDHNFEYICKVRKKAEITQKLNFWSIYCRFDTVKNRTKKISSKFTFQIRLVIETQTPAIYFKWLFPVNKIYSTTGISFEAACHFYSLQCWTNFLGILII